VACHFPENLVDLPAPTVHGGGPASPQDR